MTDKRISELSSITGSNLASDDKFTVVDSSASETKNITYSELEAAVTIATATDAAQTAQDVVAAESARDLAETYAGVDHRAATWAALATVSGTLGDIGYVGPEDTGTHTDPIAAGTVPNEGVYEWAADGLGSAQAERVGSTGLLTKLDTADVAVSPDVSLVPRSTAVGYIKPTWLAPQDSFPDDAQTLISPLAEIPTGWRDTGDTVGTRKVVARDLWAEVAARMASYRVDIVGIGDSNQIFEGHGWDSGFAKALVDAGVPMWATGLVSQNENSGSGSGQGYLYNRSGSLIGAISGAPTELDAFLNKGTGALFPAFYTYVADGGSVASSTACGLQLAAGCPIDNTAALEYDIHWGGFTSGAGQFRPQLRLDQSPFSELAGALPIVSTNTGSYGINRTTSTAPADPTRDGKAIAGKPLRTGVTGITGPFFTTYQRFRNPSRNAGFSYGTLEYRGGQPMRTMALDLQEASDEALTHYFGVLREDQDQDQNTVVITVNSGLNDRNATLPSVGPNPNADADSPEAFVDNFRAIYDRIVEIWTLNDWPMDELFFFMFVSHPIDDPDDAELVAYRTAIDDYFKKEMPRGEVVDLSALTNEAEMLSEGWYQDAGSDRSHLEQIGYEALASRMVVTGRFTQ